MVIKIENNMVALGKGDLFGLLRESSSSVETKPGQ